MSPYVGNRCDAYMPNPLVSVYSARPPLYTIHVRKSKEVVMVGLIALCSAVLVSLIYAIQE